MNAELADKNKKQQEELNALKQDDVISLKSSLENQHATFKLI